MGENDRHIIKARACVHVAKVGLLSLALLSASLFGAPTVWAQPSPLLTVVAPAACGGPEEVRRAVRQLTGPDRLAPLRILIARGPESGWVAEIDDLEEGTGVRVLRSSAQSCTILVHAVAVVASMLVLDARPRDASTADPPTPDRQEVPGPQIGRRSHGLASPDRTAPTTSPAQTETTSRSELQLVSTFLSGIDAGAIPTPSASASILVELRWIHGLEVAIGVTGWLGPSEVYAVTRIEHQSAAIQPHLRIGLTVPLLRWLGVAIRLGGGPRAVWFQATEQSSARARTEIVVWQGGLYAELALRARLDPRVDVEVSGGASAVIGDEQLLFGVSPPYGPLGAYARAGVSFRWL